MAYKLKWHDRSNKPLVFDSDVIVKMDGPNEYYMDHIKKNFDDWGDRVCAWAYVSGDDENKDQDLRVTTYEQNEKEDDSLFNFTVTPYKYDNQGESKHNTTNNSWKWSDRDKSKDVPDSKHRAFYHNIIREFLSNIENGDFDLPRSYYRRVNHIFNCGMRGTPVDWEVIKDDKLWE